MIPEELSNRRTVGQTTFWRTKDFIKAEIERENEMAEACAELEDHQANEQLAILKPPSFLNMNFKSVSQTPQTQVRQLNPDMQHNRILRGHLTPLSEDG